MKKIDLIKDVEYLLKKLPKVHKDLYALITKEKFLEVGNSIIENIKSKEFKKKNFILTLLPLFSAIKDTHTTIYTIGNKTPVYLEWVNGDYFPFVIDLPNKDLLLTKLIKVDGLSLYEYFSKVENYLVFDNDEIKKNQFSRALSDANLIKYFSKSNEKGVEYTFVGGKSIKIKPLPRGKYVDQKSIYWIEGNEFLAMRQNYYVNDKNGNFYFKYTRCREDEKYPFEKLFEDIEEQLKSNPKKLIIDLRNNQGGDSSLFNPIIDIFKSYIKKSKPKIYCLINRSVFSSGVLNTYDMKYKLGATLVGQPTGQGVNHYGEVKYICLPNTKVEVQYSSKYFKIVEDDSNIIKPDVYIEPTVEDYRNGNDVVLKYCLED
jgi:hypothetical protein